MPLPIRTTVDDIETICSYLERKPTGATSAEAKAVIGKRYLDGRKTSALKYWGLIEEGDNKIRVTEMGRDTVRNSGIGRSAVLQSVVRSVGPYLAAVERVVYGAGPTMTTADVATHWYDHFRDESSDSEKILKDQAVCFFQIAQGADLGTLIVGRRGMSTRFEFDLEAAQALVDEVNVQEDSGPPALPAPSENELAEDDLADGDEASVEQAEDPDTQPQGNRVFLTHGKNLKILDQVKEIVMFGKFEPVVAMEHETAAKPVPQKVLDDMKLCNAAVIHVSAERVLLDQSGEEVHLINENVFN